jgi:hypothetical protein
MFVYYHLILITISKINLLFSHSGINNAEGWQSQQNCTYPQYIIIKPLKYDPTRTSHPGDNSDGDSIVHLTKIQIFIHNHKIPQKIEISTSLSSMDSNITTNTNIDSSDAMINEKGTPTSGKISSVTDKIDFQRLDYITFDHAREQKSISLNVKATYIKLILHACHRYEECNSQYLDDMYSSNNSKRNEVNPFFKL